tara:strand:- start:1 stop:627 length:627 start_codon:yes stop_codon:yes gene_type:complete
MVQEDFWSSAKAAVSTAAGAAAGVVRSLQGQSPPRTEPQSKESKPQLATNPKSYADVLAAKQQSVNVGQPRDVTAQATSDGTNKVDPATLPSALAAAAKKRGEELKSKALPARRSVGDDGFKTASSQDAAHKTKLQTAKTTSDLAKRMPVPRPSPIAPKTASSDYTIKGGDSLSSLAKAHGTTVADLQRINNIKDPNKIRAGAQLRFK